MGYSGRSQRVLRKQRDRVTGLHRGSQLMVHRQADLCSMMLPVIRSPWVKPISL